jgi:copper resistance protein B
MILSITRQAVAAVVVALALGSVNTRAQASAPLTESPTQADQGARQPPQESASAAGVPPLTDADRTAAFPDVKGHAVHDNMINSFVLFDQLEWQAGNTGKGANWDNSGWIGGDLNRFWFRTEGEGEGGRLDTAYAHALYGRAIARWWDLVAGVRQDFRPGPAQTWAAIGIQGLAPEWFEVEATAYVGASGRTQVRFETEYELLLTNRVVLQPLAEFDIYGKADPERGVGAGLSTADAGIRVRYAFRREFAPYVGVVWSRKFFGTADLAEAAGEQTGGMRASVGLRFWF